MKFFYFCLFATAVHGQFFDDGEVSLQKGRLLMIEEGYNESVDNEKFLKRLDHIE